MRIEFKDKKNSSGRIRDGQIVLYISNRLSRAEQERHINLLSHRLQAVLARQRPAAGPPPGLTPCAVADNATLRAWAEELNRQHYGFRLAEVRFKTQHGRWGSCSGLTGNIYISHRLRGGPRELLEYVLIHEICHLAELNHGRRFWQLVARGCPDYPARRRLLRQYDRWLNCQG